MKVLEGKLVAGKGKFAIVASRFNEFIVSKLISAAQRIPLSATVWIRTTSRWSGCRGR